MSNIRYNSGSFLQLSRAELRVFNLRLSSESLKGGFFDGAQASCSWLDDREIFWEIVSFFEMAIILAFDQNLVRMYILFKLDLYLLYYRSIFSVLTNLLVTQSHLPSLQNPEMENYVNEFREPLQINYLRLIRHQTCHDGLWRLKSSLVQSVVLHL